MINMNNVNDVRNDLEAIANKLDRSDAQAASRLRNLSSAVGGGTYADAWATTNIYQLVAPELIIEKYRSQRATDGTIAWLEWFRNILIFAPLVVTWYGISQAVEQYNALIKADPAQITQPFLYLWQNGFGNRLAGWQTLGSLATIDFILLGSVLVLTFLVYSLSNTVKMRREQEADALHATLVHAIAGAALCLTTRNWKQPSNFVDRFNQATSHFEQIMKQLMTQLTAITERQKQEHQVFDAFKKDLATIMGTVSSAVTELKASNDALRRSMASLVAPTQDIAGKLGSVSANAQNTVDLLRNQIITLEALVKSQQQWGNELNNILKGLNASVQSSMGMTNQITDLTKQQTDLVGAIRDERTVQTTISNQMFMSSNSLAKLIPEIEKCTTELNAVNIQLADLVRRIAGAMGARRP